MSESILNTAPDDFQSPKDPRTLTSLNEILSCLSWYQSAETELSNSLTQLLSNRQSIDKSLQQLEVLVPRLDDLQIEAANFSIKVSATAQTAERVGGRVRSLDEEMRRVGEAAERVGQVMELKSSLAQLQSCIENQDWESAARCCARAMSLPFTIISGPFAESVVPTAESHLPPAQTLQAAREQLLSIFKSHFEEASRERDAAATTRYFKLFPTIGWEAEGLEAYGSFVVDLVRVRAPTSAKTSSPLYFVTALTALLESVAMIVDHHQPVVDKYYGAGKMTTVIKRLLDECDRVVRLTLDSWREDRSIKRKLLDVANSSFSIAPTRKQSSQVSSQDDDELDPREIDKLLSEIAGMSGRWFLFRKFLVEQLQDEDVEEDAQSGRVTPSDHEGYQSQIDNNLNAWGSGIQPDLLQLVESTRSHQEFDELLATYYVPMETWYMRIIIDKAHRLSSPDFSQSPVTTTTPDDVFYILKTVYSRVLSAGSLKHIERMTDLLKDFMDHDYAGGIKRKLDDVYRTAANTGGGGRGEKSERECRTSFIILLNDLDLSSSHMERLTKDLLGHQNITQLFLDAEQSHVKRVISSLTGSVAKFRSTLKAGVEQLFNQLMRPKLRTLIPDVFKDVSYVLDEDSYNAAEQYDVVRKRFVKTWEGLVDGYKDAFTDNNYRMLFGLALDVIARPWEKYILTLHFSELGAVRFDRDLRSIMAYLSSQTIFGDIREKFVRLQQISSLLNLDNEEDVDGFYSGSGISWSFSLQDAKNVVALKV
ncbi:COG4-domain-containing protein [Suillus fuscotomentosus]|uniref:Conserved oligomeric Golgi complex subunit 4 n=1 Tax=Suillus fuscotomentosus TaxID=1912939 RepID=A0AAD4ED66_9AGAM|nr:COG4-domain-containing protein [Suillus fuscotomentosus]KAG1903982.1 COG4-domain-containing protein [Suillus fuscotomentosus]